MKLSKINFLSITLLFSNNFAYSAGIEPLKSLQQIQNEELVDAVKKGNYEQAESKIEQGADVKSIIDHRTPLHYAAIGNFVDIAKLLLSKGADINAKTPHTTPLIDAAKNGNLEMVKFLLDNNANIDIKFDDSKLDAIKFAESYGHNEIAQYIKDYKQRRQKQLEETIPFPAALIELVEEFTDFKKPKDGKGG